ncbi:hypothetical protein, partial [Roseisolibacter sp. H3M3-2]|uniref:hypothetical protein n=1 Tax=Roseisolibacter sp. H3M3-2 TaxID=3031323 RepID=UPI0023DA8D38
MPSALAPAPASVPPRPRDRAVDCGCDARLHVHVLGPLSGDARVHACLRCGAVACVRPNVWEPRPHDVRLVGYTPVPLAPALHAWLAAWPRWAVRAPGEELYLAAVARGADADALPALLDAAAARA